MNYLLINASPHKGNTWLVVQQIRKQISALSPESVFKEIHLASLNLPFCIGCSLCFRKGHEKCPHNSAVQSVIDQIDWADGVIFASSTFNMQPTAMAKNLIDHLCFMLHRPYFFSKKGLVVTTTAGVGADKAAGYVAGTLRGLGFNRCYELPVVTASWNAYRMDDKAKKKCAAKARLFHQDVASKKLHRPSWLILIPYNLFRGMSLNYVKGTEYEYADGAHWTDPVRAKSFYGPSVPVPFYKRAFGQLFYGIGRMAGRFMTVTYKK